jgi:hypothetical protein
MTSANKPSRRRAQPKRVLFLDFDGVLHPTMEDLDGDSDACIATPLFGWLPLLATALASHPDVGIVVSSTWRYTHDQDELRELLGPLRGRFLGATPRGPRYESIQWWLHLNPMFASHRILDDNPREFPTPAPKELIACHPHRGVSDSEVLAQLREWLL